MNRSETIAKLTEALAKAQGMMKPAAKDSDNPFFKSKYADLASVIDACREPLSSNGLAYMQVCDIPEDKQGVIIETLLSHISGEWVSGKLFIPVVKFDPQSIGSAITYGKRYALSAIIGLPSDDDDAELAMKRNSNNGNGYAKKPEPVHIYDAAAAIRALYALFDSHGVSTAGVNMYISSITQGQPLETMCEIDMRALYTKLRNSLKDDPAVIVAEIKQMVTKALDGVAE